MAKIVLEEGMLTAADTAETRARGAMKFVKVVTVGGHLTDVSIAMLLVELKYRGVKLQNADKAS